MSQGEFVTLFLVDKFIARIPYRCIW